MKKFVIFLLAICMLVTSAMAYTCEITASCGAASRGAIAYCKVESDTNSGLTEMYAQVAIHDEDMREITFGRSQRFDPTTYSTMAMAPAYDGKLKTGETYTVTGAGYIKWMTKYGEIQHPYPIGVDEHSFVYPGRTAYENSTITQEKLEYHKERSIYLLEQFALDAEEFNYAWSIDTCNFVKTDAYIFMVDTIEHPSGATSPSYFISDDATMVYCVYQDANDVIYLYKFEEDSEGNWKLSNVQTSNDSDSYKTFAEYKQTLECNH